MAAAANSFLLRVSITDIELKISQRTTDFRKTNKHEILYKRIDFARVSPV